MEEVLATATSRFELVAAKATRKGTALDLTYRLRLRPGGSPTSLVIDLNRLEGADGVDLQRDE